MDIEQRLRTLFPEWSAQPNIEAHSLDDKTLADLEALLRRAESDAPFAMVGRTEEMMQVAAEYTAEASRLQTVLQHVGITEACLSPEAQSQLGWLSRLAGSLGLMRSTDASIMAAWAQLCRDHAVATVTLDGINEQAAAQQRSLQATVSAIADMKRHLAAARQQAAEAAPDVQRLQRESPGLEAKLTTYESNLVSIQRKLRDAGLAPHLTHRALLAQEAERDRLHNELNQAQQQLASFHGLPASIPGAEAALRHLEQELRQAQQELNRLMAEG